MDTLVRVSKLRKEVPQQIGGIVTTAVQKQSEIETELIIEEEDKMEVDEETGTLNIPQRRRCKIQ